MIELVNSEHQERCRNYLLSRTSDYAFRCRRFDAVARKLVTMGFRHWHSLMDLGAGRQDFQRFLRENYGWRGNYIPIDGALDGTDLNYWKPEELALVDADFVVAIEVVEHLYLPEQFIETVQDICIFGAVITTPNPAVVDVLACDPTHVSVVGPERIPMEWKLDCYNLFGRAGDTIVASYEVPEYGGH